MIENFATSLPLQMLLSAAFGFLACDVRGDNRHHRKCLDQANDELRYRLYEVRVAAYPIHRKLKQQRGILNDIQIYLAAATKALENAYPGPQQDQRPDLTNRAASKRVHSDIPHPLIDLHERMVINHASIAARWVAPEGRYLYTYEHKTCKVILS